MMSKKQIKTTIWTFIICLVLVNLPFLPGPNFLNVPSQIFFSIGQLLAIMGILILPIGCLWILFNKVYDKSIIRPVLYTIVFFVSLISFFYLTDHIRDFSRNIGIMNGNKLVKQIEAYERENGHFPKDIKNSSFTIPHSWIIGINNYNYSTTNTGFEVYFTQNLLFGYNFEIVSFYNTVEHSAQSELKTLYDTIDPHLKFEIFD